MKTGITIIVILAVQVYCETDFFASLVQLEDVYNNEEKLLKLLDNFLNHFEEKIGEIRGKVIEVKENRENVTDVAQYLQNPINSFKFLSSLDQFVSYIKNTTLPMFDLIKHYEDIDDSTGWPQESDVEGAANALVRLQNTYSLNINDLIKGKIFDNHTTPLTVLDTFTIGKTALKSQNEKLAKEWLEKAFAISNNNGFKDLKLKINITENYAYTFFLDGNLKKCLKLTELLLRLEPGHERALSNKQYLLDELNQVPIPERSGKFMTDPMGKFDYHKLYYFTCQGKRRQSDEVLSKLKCRYVHHNNPFLMIGPAKEEEANLEPRIVVYREVLNDYDIELLQTTAKQYLERSKVQGGGAGDIRVSKIAWLSDEAEGLDKITKLLGAVADLSYTSAEKLQVVNYGLGGHYLPHYDAFDEELAAEAWGSKGNRIATLLLYMNKVDEGGATIFTTLGVKVSPEKGSALFWHNLHSDGQLDTRTVHAACPVVLGTKWAVNVWYHEGDNLFTKPCPLTKMTENIF